MFSLLERWAALESSWCRLTEDGISFGPEENEGWIAWDWEFVPQKEARSVQQAVIEAIKLRGWSWQRLSDGTVTVGQPAALHSIVVMGRNFAHDLLNAYVQRLEMEATLLALD